jgi:hypothetical protein
VSTSGIRAAGALKTDALKRKTGPSDRLPAQKFLAAPRFIWVWLEQFFAKSTLVNRWKEFRENRKQLRCCNWIRFPKVPIFGSPGGEGGEKEGGDRAFVECPMTAGSQKSEHFPDLLSFAPPCVRAGATKLLRQKEE